jgi:predicted double-glycine peptidase
MKKKNKKKKDRGMTKKSPTAMNLKPVLQSPGLCGPAALRIVLDYYGIAASEEKLAKLSHATESKGTTAEGMIKAARSFNLQVLLKDDSSLADLNYFVKRKIPVIVDWFSEDDGHYSVVSRLDSKRIFLVSPSSRISEAKELKMPVEKFLRVWFDFPGPFIKRKKDLVLRRMIVLTPFREKFPIPDARIK